MSTTKQSEWYLYILKCSDKYLYTGISNNVAKRLLAHRNGKGARFTKGKHPIELVYVERKRDVRDALKYERQVKKYSKKKKEFLIKCFVSDLKGMKDLYIKELFNIS